MFLNGVACKDPARVSAGDFAFSGLHAAGDTANAFGSKVTLVDARAVPGLNSLGVAMARLDLAPGGLNPPHTHPRASEVLTVVEGQMHAGFVAADGTLFARVLSAGDAFVFPRGLVHFEINFGERPAVGIAGLSSQNPGVVRVADSPTGHRVVLPPPSGRCGDEADLSWAPGRLRLALLDSEEAASVHMPGRLACWS